MKRMLILLLLLTPALAQAQARALPAPPQTEFVQRLDVPLPLQLHFTDDGGRQVRLAEYFDGRPVVLVLGYYHCPNLCSTLMEGVLPVLAQANLPADAYRVVEVSIDPGEDASLAARRKVSYEPMLGRRGGELHLLTGSEPAIARLAKDAGFHYAYDADLRQYVHPAGFLVATPQGRISHYFMGVRFEPRDLRLALVDASAGRIGSPVDRLLLLCAHYDPHTGRYTVTVMTIVRIVCLLVLALLATWIWRHRAGRRGRR